MAVLVHARLDAPLKMSNGALTLTLKPETFDELAVMEFNAQYLDGSVANPEPGELPKADRVVLAGGEEQPTDNVTRW